MFFISLSLLWLSIASAFGYLIIVTDTDPPGSEIFDGGLLNYKQPSRKYYMNIDKSASFVEKLLEVNSSTGAVTLREYLSCDGFKYPNIFTLYVDSSSSGIYEYVSVPLKVYVHGCESADKSEGTHIILLRVVLIMRTNYLRFVVSFFFFSFSRTAQRYI